MWPLITPPLRLSVALSSILSNHVRRQLVHSSSQRWVRLTDAAYLHQRCFFASSTYLQNNDDPKPTHKLQQPSTERAEPAIPAASKRKSTRSSGVKNSLRRVAIIAQQPGRAAAAQQAAASHPPGGQRSTAEDADADTIEDSSRRVRAVCAAEAFDMDRAVAILRAHGFSLDPDGAGFEAHEVVHARGAGSGDTFVFPSGTVVTWGLEADVVETLATKQLLPAAIDPHISRFETEDLEFSLDPSRENSTIKGDVIVLGSRREVVDGERLDTTLAKIAFSSGLARSTKLAVLETSLTAYFESTRQIPVMLSRNEKVPLSKTFIMQKTGELLSLRAQLNHYSELTDSLPDLFWDSRSELGLEGYYDEVGRALDVNIRIKTLNQKMDYAQEIASVLREMSNEKHNTRLEWIIIILIAVEVLFELRRVYRELVDEQHREQLEEELERTMGSGKERENTGTES